MTDWKPGDVAMVRFGGGDIEPAILTNTGRWYSLIDGCWDSGGMEPIRPLVVIDPENPEDVKRLAEIISQILPDDLFSSDLADALREFAAPTPPKPAEPTGLGAVVEDASGFCWVKVDTAMNCDSWTQADAGMAGADTWRKYVGLNAVRVLSEGVPQ